MKLPITKVIAGVLAAFSLVANGQLQPTLPSATQDCPKISEGVVRFLDVPVDIVVAGPAQQDGPLVLYWHGTGTRASDELEFAFNVHTRQQLRDAGGVLAAVEHSTGIGDSTSGNNVWTVQDMLIADEIVACAVAQMGIDPRRIHVFGMSAGGLHTTAMGYQRSHYLASIATLSGGHLLLHGQNGTDTRASQPDNKFAALIMHGGDSDRYILRFADTSTHFAETLRSRGHTAHLCDHGQGHTIPESVSTAVWRFFRDHPFGTEDHYQGTLPAEVTRLCQVE